MASSRSLSPASQPAAAVPPPSPSSVADPLSPFPAARALGPVRKVVRHAGALEEISGQIQRDVLSSAPKRYVPLWGVETPVNGWCWPIQHHLLDLWVGSLAARVSIYSISPATSLILRVFLFARCLSKAACVHCRISPPWQKSGLLSCSQDHQSLRSHAAFFRLRRLHYDVQ